MASESESLNMKTRHSISVPLRTLSSLPLTTSWNSPIPPPWLPVLPRCATSRAISIPYQCYPPPLQPPFLSNIHTSHSLPSACFLLPASCLLLQPYFLVLSQRHLIILMCTDNCFLRTLRHMPNKNNSVIDLTTAVKMNLAKLAKLQTCLLCPSNPASGTRSHHYTQTYLK